MRVPFWMVGTFSGLACEARAAKGDGIQSSPSPHGIAQSLVASRDDTVRLMDEVDRSNASLTYECPACGQPVAPPVESAPVLQCPSCGEQFFIPESAHEDNVVEAHTIPEAADDREAELSALRIRNITVLRRAAFRTRSYCIVVGAACGVGAIKLLLMMFHLAVETKFRMRPVGYAVFASYAILAAACAWGAAYFGRRVMKLTRELKRPMLEEPTTPPDLSTLSDGTQHVRNLEEMDHTEDLHKSEKPSC